MSNLYKFLNKFDRYIFLLFQLILLMAAILSDSRFNSLILLTYFYYSIFTGWHECVHREKDFKGKVSLNSILGAISIAPLLFLSYKEKIKLHIYHHGFTNDKYKDPDYSTNNLIFLKSNKSFFYSLDSKFTALNLIEILFKILFLGVVLIWILSGKSLIDFTIGYILGNSIMHFIVNIYPHFNTNNKFGRDLGGNKLLTLFLFSNNLHGVHHREPKLPWWANLLAL